MIGSRSHSSKEFLNWVEKKFTNFELITIGSSLKFCILAEGKADIYPRFGPTSEWDIAAGHAIVQNAGGIITDFNGNEILYGKENFKNPSLILKSSNDL